MEIMRNDLEITLTDDELEEAYQERLLAINRQKAREHLIDLFDDKRDEFEQSYSISLDEFMADNKYIDVIIDHFNECENLNASENVMWTEAIMITLGDGYAVMLVLPHEDGLSPEQVTALVNDIERHSFGECEIEPIRIEGEYAWCFGFMSHKAFDEKLDFDARESSPFGKDVKEILDDLSLENENGIYMCHGILTKILYKI